MNISRKFQRATRSQRFLTLFTVIIVVVALVSCSVAQSKPKVTLAVSATMTAPTAVPVVTIAPTATIDSIVQPTSTPFPKEASPILVCPFPRVDLMTQRNLASGWKRWDGSELSYKVTDNGRISTFTVAYAPMTSEVILQLLPSSGGSRVVMSRDRLVENHLTLVVPGLDLGSPSGAKIVGPIYFFTCGDGQIFYNDDYKDSYSTMRVCPFFDGWITWQKMPDEGFDVDGMKMRVVSANDVGANISFSLPQELTLFIPNSWEGMTMVSPQTLVHFWTCGKTVYYRTLPVPPEP